MKIKLNLFVLSELSLIFVLWLFSVLISSPVFNRPLGDHHEWLTAHTLVSMRAFEEWGFWKLLGASVLTPKSYEFMNVDITTLTKDDGIYLSYPSFWLILPYVTFKLLIFLGLNINLSVQYIQIYNIIINRLILGIVIYYLCLKIINIITRNKLTKYTKSLISFLCLTGWMFTPPVMYYSQNVYFSDQAILLFIYSIFLISLKCKFNFKILSHSNKILLFITSFLACSIDWYAWVTVAIISLIVFFDKFILQYRSNFSFITFLKKYLDSVKFIWFGLFLAGLIFLFQIVYYKNGSQQLLETFFLRSINIIDDDNNRQLNLLDIIRRIITYWIDYFPQFLRPILLKVITSNPLRHLFDIKYLAAIFIVFLLILLLASLLYYAYKQSTDKKLTFYIYILVYFVPLLQISLLKQHSYIHEFSALKMALPIVFSLLLLPMLVLFEVLENKLYGINFRSSKYFFYILCFALILSLAIIISSRNEFIKFVGVSNKKYQDIGFIAARNVTQKDLLIADPNKVNEDDSLVFGSFPPEPVWYTDRFIHSSEKLKDLRLKLNIQDLKKMKLVFLAYKNLSSASSVNFICKDQWQDVGKVAKRDVVICKAEGLRHLLDEN